MNKWQKYYLDEFYDGEMPKSKIGKLEYEELGEIKNRVVVHFPKFDSPIPSQRKKAHTEEFTVTKNDCNMPNGKISVAVLAGNLTLWRSRGYKIETF